MLRIFYWHFINRTNSLLQQCYLCSLSLCYMKAKSVVKVWQCCVAPLSIKTGGRMNYEFTTSTRDGVRVWGSRPRRYIWGKSLRYPIVWDTWWTLEPVYTLWRTPRSSALWSIHCVDPTNPTTRICINVGKVIRIILISFVVCYVYFYTAGIAQLV